MSSGKIAATPGASCELCIWMLRSSMGRGSSGTCRTKDGSSIGPPGPPAYACLAPGPDPRKLMSYCCRYCGKPCARRTDSCMHRTVRTRMPRSATAKHSPLCCCGRQAGTLPAPGCHRRAGTAPGQKLTLALSGAHARLDDMPHKQGWTTGLSPTCDPSGSGTSGMPSAAVRGAGNRSRRAAYCCCCCCGCCCCCCCCCC